MKKSDATDVVLLSELYPPAVGGSAVLMQNVYERFQRYSVSVITDQESSPGEDGNHGGVSVYRRRFATRRWGILGLREMRDHGRTIGAVRSVPLAKRTVIHCSRVLPEGVSTLLGYPFLRRRVVCWAHGEELTTACASREFAFLIERAFRASAAVLANSYNTLRLLEGIRVPSNNVAVVHPGVDVNLYRPDVDGSAFRERYAPQGGPLICSIGRLQRRKGHDHAIEAVAVLKNDLPQVRYLIVGDGEERGRLESMTRDLNVQDRVFFTGQVPKADLPKYFAACDVFLHPNRIFENDSEGFGIVFLEAQAAGKPVVGGRSGGVPETMIEGKTGMLVSGEDVSETVHVLRELLSNAERRKQMGEAGRRHVTEYFTWERAAALVENVHQDVVEFGSLLAARRYRA